MFKIAGFSFKMADFVFKNFGLYKYQKLNFTIYLQDMVSNIF